MLKEFKEFAMRGSVVDLAVGVIIGASFGKIVSSLVDDRVQEQAVVQRRSCRYLRESYRVVMLPVQADEHIREIDAPHQAA